MQTYQGLNEQQVLASRQQHGANTLTPAERIPAWKLFLQKFNDPIIKLLLFATLLSFITGYFHGSFAESFGILIAVFLATFLSFINEYRAAKEFDVLNQINDSVLVKVYRDGNVVMIPKTEIVVGDYVIVEQGDEIPADGVVVDAMSLSVNESTLNGESVPAEKKPGEVLEFEGAYAPNKIYRGTTVSEGSGVMEVFAVGDATEIGKTARQATELTGQQTPLNQQLDKLSGIISKISFIVAGTTFLALCVLDFVVQGKPFDWTMETFEMLLSFFMIAVTLIVVAVPALVDLAYLENILETRGENVDKDLATVLTADRQFNRGTSDYTYDSADLNEIADDVLSALRKTIDNTDHTGFWDEETGRFVAGYAEAEDKWYDYGYTMWNMEAIYYT